MDGTDFFAAIALTCLSWWLVRAYLIAQMSNVSLASAAREYLVKSSVSITGRSDTYLYTNVERSPRSKK